MITSWCFKTTLKKWLNQICFWRFMRSRSHYLSSCQRAIHQTRSQWVNPSHCNINKVSCTPTVWCFAQQRFSNLHQLFEKSSHKLAVQSQDFRYHVREMIIGSLNTIFFCFFNCVYRFTMLDLHISMVLIKNNRPHFMIKW